MPGISRADDEALRAESRPEKRKLLLGRWLAVLFGDYQLFRIYRYDLADMPEIDLSPFLAEGYAFREAQAAEIAAASDEAIRARAHYCGEDAFAFAVWQGGEIVCAQWYWFGDRYRRRNFWPLESSQAKSVELFTGAAHRGKGLATALKMYSASRMKERGFGQLFSRIWHSHRESCRVSEKAGWKHIATVAELSPLRLNWNVRLVYRRRALRRRGAGAAPAAGLTARPRN